MVRGAIDSEDRSGCGYVRFSDYQSCLGGTASRERSAEMENTLPSDTSFELFATSHHCGGKDTHKAEAVYMCARLTSNSKRAPTYDASSFFFL